MTSRVRRTLTLLRIGRAARRGSGAPVGRFVALVSGTLALAVGFLVIAGSWAVYEERARHEAARMPAGDYDLPANKAKAWMTSGFDTLQDHMQFFVFSIEPVTADAPLPPGLPRWPQPGEAFVSPQLLKDGAGEQIADRYGKFAGVIGEEGLGVPDERVVWRRPAQQGSLRGTYGVEEFIGLERAKGMRGGEGESLFIFSWREFSYSVLLLLTFPALVLVYVANGFGVEERRRRDVLLETLGAGASQRRWVRVGDVAGPVLAGVAVAAAATAVVAWRSPRLPVTGFVVPGEYLRLHWTVLAGSLVAAGILTAAWAALVPARRRQNSTRPGTAQENGRIRQTLRLLAFPLALLATLWLPGVFDPGTTHGRVWSLVYLIGVVATFITLPLTFGVLVGAMGKMVAAWGRLRCSTAGLVGGRRMSHAPSGTARTVAGVIVLVGILLQTNVWSNLLTRYERADNAINDASKSSGVTLDITGDDDLRPFLAKLPEGLVAFAFQEVLENDTSFLQRKYVLTGECSDLSSLGFSCQGKQDLSVLPPQSRKIMNRFYIDGSDVVRVKVGSVAAVNKHNQINLLIVDPSGRAVDLSQIKKIAFRTIPSPPNMDHVDDIHYGDGTSTACQSRWIVLFGFGSVLILGISLGITAATRFRDQAGTLGPLSMMTGRRAPFWGIGAWTIAVPMVLGSWVALGVSRIVIEPMINVPNGPTLSGPLQILAPASLTVIALLTWVYVSANTVRSLRTWRPRNA